VKWFKKLFGTADRRPQTADRAGRDFFAPEMAVAWTESDRDALRRFLNTVHGEALKSALNAKLADVQGAAVDSGVPYKCGVARGWGEAASMLILLSVHPTPPKTETPEFVVAGDEDVLEQPNSP